MELLSLNQRCKKMVKAAITETGKRKRYQHRDDLRQFYTRTTFRHSAQTRTLPNRPELD
jgi:hypothetical protein